MLTPGVKLIPDRRAGTDVAQSYGMGEYLTEILVLPESPAVGRPLRESPLVRELDLDILEIHRGGRRLAGARRGGGPRGGRPAPGALRHREDPPRREKGRDRPQVGPQVARRRPAVVRGRPAGSGHRAGLGARGQDAQGSPASARCTAARRSPSGTAARSCGSGWERPACGSGDVLLVEVRRDRREALQRTRGLPGGFRGRARRAAAGQAPPRLGDRRRYGGRGDPGPPADRGERHPRLGPAGAHPLPHSRRGLPGDRVADRLPARRASCPWGSPWRRPERPGSSRLCWSTRSAPGARWRWFRRSTC